MKYLIIGTGGTGACIGGFLAADHNDVSFISRGKTLEQLKQNGLILKTGIRGELHLPNIKVFSSEEFMDKADVIFVCVKTYSIDEIIPVIRKVSHENSIIIPIMNGYGIADKISEKLKKAHVLSGCVYISAFIDAPGSITQLGNLFRIVFGTRKDDSINLKFLEEIKNTLSKSGIKAVLSTNVDRDVFKKFAFISPYATCAAYYDITAKGMQQEGEYRKTFIELCEEIKEISKKLEFEYEVDLTEVNLKILDALMPDSTASMQKDMKENKKSEIDGLVFEGLRLADKLGVCMPIYSKIAESLGYIAEGGTQSNESI